jgi:tripartite-type tricarboxylate transporter receptor subunit TctC
MTLAPWTRRAFLASAAGVAATSALPGLRPLAHAEEYPSRPVRIIVPFPTASSPDVVARWLSPKLYERLGQPFVVEDRPGAGSVIGVDAAVRSIPDGYTLLMGATVAMAINVTLHKNLPYDPTTDLIPLAFVGRGPFVLVVTSSLPVNSVRELIGLAKAKPGQLSFGSTGPGTPGHLYGELLNNVAGIQMTHVPYTGSGALNDVIGGNIPLMFADVAPAIAMIQAGKLRPLAVTSKSGLPALPNVPSMDEAGVPEFDAASWVMLAAPSKTPRPIIERLHHELKMIITTSEFKEQIEAIGMVPTGDTAENASVEALRFCKIGNLELGKAGASGWDRWIPMITVIPNRYWSLRISTPG